MKKRSFWSAFCVSVVVGAIVPCAFGQEHVVKQSKTATPGATTVATTAEAAPQAARRNPLFFDFMASKGLKSRHSPVSASSSRNYVSIGRSAVEASAYGGGGDTGPTLPLWTFRVRSSRDGNKYSGAMVGTSPFQNPRETTVPTKVIPVIIKTQNVVTAFDPTTGILTTIPGNTTFDPTQPDNGCLATPNNVPAQLLKQSPMFNKTKFVFGGTYVGTTEYSDAFQRANFWNALGEDRDSYHVLLQPVQFLEPIVLEVPVVYGLAVNFGDLFGPSASCGPSGIVDINWFDTYLTGTVIPSLANGPNDVDPTNLPIFMVYNVVWGSPANNLFTCCILGYHGTTGFPIPTQTYSPADFDTTQSFANSSGSTAGFSDTAILSHEVDEWMNDPMISNPTPPWGNTGQVVGCQANLEVGDPLTGTTLPPVTMPNGFTYHLQELAFFSWFFGAPSIGIHGWYSDNGTFTTDAGAPCY